MLIPILLLFNELHKSEHLEKQKIEQNIPFVTTDDGVSNGYK